MSAILVCVRVCVMTHRRPQGTEQEFFVQLFVEPDPSLPKPPSIEDLLKTMFNDQKIKFTEVRTSLTLCVCVCVCI